MAKKISKENAKNEKELGIMRKNSVYGSINTIAKMIRQGATVEDITEKYSIAESTLRRYLRKHFVRKDTVNRYNRLLRENAKAKHTNVVVKLEESVTSTEIGEKIAEMTAMIEPAKNFPNFFIIDPILIQVHENRKSFGKVLEKLTSKHLDFVIYSKSRLEKMSESYSKSAAMLAKEILENEAIKKAETILMLSEYSAFMEGIVITDSEAKNGSFLRNSYKVITFEEFLDNAPEMKEVDENKKDSIDYARKLTVPVTLNKMGRMICDLRNLQEHLENVYGVNNIVDIKITSESGTERKTPTGKLMLKIGDTINLKAVDDDGSGFIAKLSIIKNDTANNAVETYYDANYDESASADNHNCCAETEFTL